MPGMGLDATGVPGIGFEPAGLLDFAFEAAVESIAVAPTKVMRLPNSRATWSRLSTHSGVPSESTRNWSATAASRRATRLPRKLDTVEQSGTGGASSVG